MDEERSSRRLDDEEVNLLDYWRVVRKRLRLIVLLCTIAVLATMGHSLRLPKIYDSTATILPPDDRSAKGLGLTAALAASGIVQAIPGLSMPSLASHRDTFISVLKSRTMAQDVVEQFDLQQRYEATFVGDAIRRVQQLTVVLIAKDGTIAVKVEETDPELAAAMANFYVANLDRMLARFTTTEATKERDFIAHRLAETVGELRRAEEALRQFQDANRVIALPEQARGAVEAAALLKGEIMASEVQLEVMRNFATEVNPEVVKLKRRIEEMKRHLAQTQYGRGWIRRSRLTANPSRKLS